MQSLNAESFIKSLQTAGVRIAPTADGGLLVAPASRLTPEQRQTIRECKSELLRYFSVFDAANDSAPKPTIESGAWRVLAAAYHAHHFRCPNCVAAGSGGQYASRCEVGLRLWNDYNKTQDLNYQEESKQ